MTDADWQYSCLHCSCALPKARQSELTNLVTPVPSPDRHCGHFGSDDGPPDGCCHLQGSTGSRSAFKCAAEALRDGFHFTANPSSGRTWSQMATASLVCYSSCQIGCSDSLQSEKQMQCSVWQAKPHQDPPPWHTSRPAPRAHCGRPQRQRP